MSVEPHQKTAERQDGPMQPKADSVTELALDEIDRISRESTLRQAYHDGLQDGALSALAPALGVESTTGQPTHTLIGRRFKVTVEWLDPMDERDLDLARQFAARALNRIEERHV